MPKWLKVALVGLLVTLVLVVVGQRFQSSNLSEKIAEKAPALGPGAYLLLPNLQDAKVVVPDRPHDPVEVHSQNKQQRITRLRSFLVSTNAKGFRGPPLEPQKTSYRVLCLGDSVTFGWGVAEDESYPARLRKSLGLEVINAGVPAMKPVHIAAYMQQHL